MPNRRWAGLACAVLACAWLSGASPAAEEQTPAPAPVPSREKLAAAEMSIRAKYREQYAKRLRDERLALAAELLDRGKQSPDDPAARYVLLREARDIYVALGELPQAFEALDALAQRFAVPVMQLKLAALNAAASNADTAALRNANLLAGLGLLDALMARDQFEEARNLLPVLQGQVRKTTDAARAAKAEARLAKVQPSLAEWLQVRPALKVLETSPNDPGASLAAARYYILSRGNWIRALPLLAQSASAPLAAAARRDLAGPHETLAQLETAEAWWSAAQKESGPLQTALLRRAADWYAQVLPALTGEQKTVIEERIRAAGAGAPPPKVNP